MFDCEQNTVVYPPNKILERRVDFSKSPVIYDHQLFIDFNDKGEAIAGSSSINCTLWEGTTLFFNDATALQNLNYNKWYIGSTVSDAKFLNQNTIVLAEDVGILNILNVRSETSILESINYFRHLCRIPRVAVWKNGTRILCCSENSMVLWDVTTQNKTPLQNYQNYHTACVNDVDVFQKEPNVFLSAATDKKCCIWDERNENPATVLYVNEFCSLTSVACNQNNPNYVVVGTEAGDIYLIDRREPKEFITVSHCNCNIYRIKFDNSNKLAICGDMNKVLVFKCEDEILTNTYCNDKHSGIIRGLAWHNEALYSSGFDKQIIKHTL